MPLIRTKFLPATNTKGTRIKAYYQEQSVTLGYNFTGNLEHNHKWAMQHILNRFNVLWLYLDIQTERLSDLEYVHVWKENT